MITLEQVVSRTVEWAKVKQAYRVAVDELFELDEQIAKMRCASTMGTRTPRDQESIRQCEAAYKTAQQVLAMLRKGMVTMEKDLIDLALQFDLVTAWSN